MSGDQQQIETVREECRTLFELGDEVPAPRVEFLDWPDAKPVLPVVFRLSPDRESR